MYVCVKCIFVVMYVELHHSMVYFSYDFVSHSDYYISLLLYKMYIFCNNKESESYRQTYRHRHTLEFEIWC